MYRILFICHGNICRSPMAEFIMKKLVKEAGRENDFLIASAAVSSEELGNPVYPPARRILNSMGIDTSGKTAVQVKKSDLEKYDILIGMDSSNLSRMKRIFGESDKLRLLLDYTKNPGDIADPWYYGNFDKTCEQITDGCKGLLAALD